MQISCTSVCDVNTPNIYIKDFHSFANSIDIATYFERQLDEVHAHIDLLLNDPEMLGQFKIEVVEHSVGSEGLSSVSFMLDREAFGLLFLSLGRATDRKRFVEYLIAFDLAADHLKNGNVYLSDDHTLEEVAHSLDMSLDELEKILLSEGWLHEVEGQFVPTQWAIEQGLMTQPTFSS